MSTDIAETNSEYGDLSLTQFGQGTGKGLGIQLNADSKWLRLTQADASWLIRNLGDWLEGLAEKDSGREPGLCKVVGDDGLVYEVPFAVGRKLIWASKLSRQVVKVLDEGEYPDLSLLSRALEKKDDE
jgi:hypothetical protein